MYLASLSLSLSLNVFQLWDLKSMKWLVISLSVSLTSSRPRFQSPLLYFWSLPSTPPHPALLSQIFSFVLLSLSHMFSVTSFKDYALSNSSIFAICTFSSLSHLSNIFLSLSPFLLFLTRTPVNKYGKKSTTGGLVIFKWDK